jgi:hypothetical protein
MSATSRTDSAGINRLSITVSGRPRSPSFGRRVFLNRRSWNPESSTTAELCKPQRPAPPIDFRSDV